MVLDSDPGGRAFAHEEGKTQRPHDAAFADKLDDAQVVALTTYIRNAWGNKAARASGGDVSRLRKTFATASR